jgi:hypothetical protein
MVPFAKAWGKMHDFDKYSKAEQREMAAKMGPFYGLQLLVTILSAFVLAWLLAKLPDENAYLVALMVWLGFVLPTQVSAVIFGGTKAEYIWQKIVLMAGEALVHLLVAALVITLIQG